MKKIILAIAFLASATALFAGTLLEQSIKGYDPYLADRDGFDSLFVNPAGISGQTQWFTLDLEGGTWGKLKNYKLLKDNVGIMQDLASGDLTAADAGELMPMIVDNIDAATWSDLSTAAGGSLGGQSLATVQGWDEAMWASQDPTELDNLANAIAADPAGLQAAIMNQFDEVNYSVEAEARLGTLINGFGFGIYNNDYILYSLGAQGIEDMVFELGAVSGYGFDVGSFSFGVSGKFALLLADNPAYAFDMSDARNQQILYGYAWGIDAGAIWEPIDSLSFAVLFSDILGSVTPVDDMGSGTIDDFLSGNIAGPSGGYAWNLDVSTGLTWQPDWKGIRPKFSLDFHDLVGLVREYNDSDFSGVQDFYQTDSNPFLRHMRVGANVRFLGFLDVGASYYLEYITLGVGVDIKFFETFVEVKTKQNFQDVGANMMMKLKF